MHKNTNISQMKVIVLSIVLPISALHQNIQKDSGKKLIKD